MRVYPRQSLQQRDGTFHHHLFTLRLSFAAVLLLRFTCVLVLIGTIALWAQPVQAQLPATVGWTALPASTSLQGSGACPPNYFEGDTFPFGELCANVIRAWSGAVADTTANRLLIWGGGHMNYYGNEIYSLNLTANPITLTRVKDPTVPTNYANNENCIDWIPPDTTDFAPNSRESYGGMEFIPGPYQMYIEGGSLACNLGNQTQNTWTIPLANLSNSSRWVHMNPTLVGPLPGSDGGYTYGNVAAYDPNTGLVFLSDSASIYTYNFQTNTYTLISPADYFVTSIYLSGAIDPVRKLFVLVGGCPGGTCGPGDGVFVANISNPTTTSRQNWTAATMANPVCAEFLSGGVNSISASNPGIVYDSVANDFVAWPNQGNSVYILTPDTVNQQLTCQKLTFANGPPNSSYPDGTPNVSTGTFGRFRYFPALDVFVLVNDWDIPAYILRLRPATGYSITATPTTATANPGGSATYTVSVAALGSFTGTVNLSVSGLPSGATASLSPTSIETSGSSTLTVTVPAGSSASSQILTITGASGSLTQTAMVTLDVTVPDFALTAAPSIATVSPGASATYTVSTSAISGFTGSVGLSVSGLPTGATPSFNPTSIAAGASSTLTIATTSSTPVGSPTLTITGTSGSLTNSANVILNVTSTTSLSASAISIDFVGAGTTPMGSSEVAGVVALSDWNDAAGASNSSPLALVDHNGNPTAATVTWTSDDVWDQPITDQPGNARMMKGYLDNGRMDTTTVTVSGLPTNANGYTVYVYAQGASSNTSNTGIYQISGTGITTTSATLTYNSNFNGTFTQATASNLVGNYVVLTIPNVPSFTLSAIPSTASNGYERAPLNGIQIVPITSLTPNFTISASPATQSVSQGNSTTYTVGVAALNGFTGTVNLSVTSGLPTGATPSFNPTSIAAGASSTLTIATTSSTPVGSPTLTITGTSGSLTNSANVILNVTSTTSPSASAISIDFVGAGTTPMGSSEVAGVVALSDWNDAAGASNSSPLALVDHNGNPTAATVTWTSDDVWDQPITDQPGNARMMKGYLDNGRMDTTTVTVSGLPTNANGYTVYVYAQGASSNTSNTGIYQISGTGITTTSATLTYNSNFNGTFTQATASNLVGNYVVLTIPNVPSFTLSAIPSTASNGYERAPLNGIQIVPN